jgi:putative membrane protein
MKKKTNMTWKEAFLASPGPNSIREAGFLSLKGLCMGSADIIPGVSGGTIALITGIYTSLLQAIKSANTIMIQKLLTFDIKGALAEVHLRFIVALFLGIGVAIISLARLMHFLLNNYPIYTWSLFFGLIAASILVVGKRVEKWNLQTGLCFVIGGISAHLIVNLIPVSTPESYAFIFFSGFIAICAMILPGISGAFILLILGKYEFITATLKDPFSVTHMLIIIVFCAGCIAGLLSFSRILSYLLTRYQFQALAFLTGLMAGSIEKIWPWKQVLDSIIIREKVHVIADKNILPEAFNVEVVIAIGLVVTGFVAVIVLERISEEKVSKKNS